MIEELETLTGQILFLLALTLFIVLTKYYIFPYLKRRSEIDAEIDQINAKQTASQNIECRLLISNFIANNNSIIYSHIFSVEQKKSVIINNYTFLTIELEKYLNTREVFENLNRIFNELKISNNDRYLSIVWDNLCNELRSI